MKNFKPETLQARVISALNVRIENAANENMRATLQDEVNQFSKKSTLAALDYLQSLSFDISALCKRIEKSDKKDADFVAVYALQKVRKAIFALANKNSAMLDRYTFSIAKNLQALQALDNINAQRAICSKIELDEMQQAQAIRVYHNCNPSTASTQASSTRMMLQALDICNVHKGAKGDSISFTDSATAQAMQALFA